MPYIFKGFKMKALTIVLLILFAFTAWLNTREAGAGAVVAEIDGVSVQGFKGWFKNGILTLYTGKDPVWEYGQKISFWHLPEEADGQSIEYPARDDSTRPGQMTYAKKDPDVNISTVWLKEFKYKVRFGREKDFRVPVTIEGEAARPHTIKIRGNLEAATAGVKMNNGVIDRGFDHLDTIMWITKEWIRKNNEVKEFFNTADSCSMERAPKKKSGKPFRRVAECSFLYLDQGGKIRIAKLWLEKVNGRWKEVESLKPEQLFKAHPIKPPYRNKPPYIFTRMAALTFEKEIYKSMGGYMRLKEPARWVCGGGQKKGQPGYCEIRYVVYQEDRTGAPAQGFDCEVVTYIFEPDQQGEWAISQTLDSDQKFNLRKQKVLPRKKETDLFCD
jgi:hypothetical protein